MTDRLSPADMAKRAAAQRAVDNVEDGMRVGLGTGSTAAWMVRCLGERVRAEGLRITAVPTSTRTADLAREMGIAVISLDAAGRLDLTIDGTDEIDPDFNLIKGGGGALLHEKIVAAASDRMIVIADDTKAVPTLGAFALPVEVIRFGWQSTRSLIEDLIADMGLPGRTVTLRQTGDRPFATDEGNHVLDLHLERIDDPHRLSMRLNQIPGVVENGLFLDMCRMVILGSGDGRAETRDKTGGQDAGSTT